MTSIAMSAGMLPSALGVGEGGAFRAPMAIAVIGGIIVSTVLSLVVVPSFFLIIDDISRLLGWALGRLVGKREPEPEALESVELTRILTENSRTISSLEERLNALDTGSARPAPKKASPPANDVGDRPLAAE
jgi:hypothetical protein